MSKLFGKPRSQVIKHPGAFAKQASARGMSTHEFQQMVMRHSERYPAQTVRRASLARTFEKMRAKRK